MSDHLSGSQDSLDPQSSRQPAMHEEVKLETSANFGQTISYEQGAVSLSEVISALTFALDLTDGAVPGHSLRTCLIGMRLAATLGVPEAELTSLYYALLLKDIGCSDNAARLSQIMGAGEGPWSLDGLAIDMGTNPALLERIWREVLPEVPLPDRIGRMLGISSAASRDQRSTVDGQSTRGTRIMQHLGMSTVTIEAV